MFSGKSLLPDYLQDHEFKIYVLVLFCSRFLIPLLLFQLANNYTAWLHNIAFLMDNTSVEDIWTPYPFLMNFFIYFLYVLSFNDYVIFSLTFFLFNALSDTVNGIIIWKMLERSKYSYSPYMRWLYAYSPLPVMWVSLQVAVEPYILMMLLLAVYFIRQRRILPSSFLATLGASLKVFPIFAILSTFISSFSKSNFIKKYIFYTLIFALFLNFIFFLNPSGYLSSFYWQLNRPAWGSMFSLLGLWNSYDNNLNSSLFKEFINNLANIELIKYGILGITPAPSILQNVVHLEFSYVKLISLALIVSSLAIFCYFAKKKSLDIVNLLLGVLCLFFVFSFGFSPQYIMYVFILLFIVLKPEKFMFILVLMQIFALLEYPFSIILYYLNILTLNGTLIMFYTAVVARDILLLYIPIQLIRKNEL